MESILYKIENKINKIKISIKIVIQKDKINIKYNIK